MLFVLVQPDADMRHDLRARVDDALRRLGAFVGADLALGEEGVVGFELSDGRRCSIEVPAEAGHVFLHAAVGRLPESGRARLLAAALERNLFALAPAGAWLALDAASDELLLCRAVSAGDFDPDDLPEIVLSMTDGVARLREDLFAEALPDAVRAVSGEMLIRA